MDLLWQTIGEMMMTEYVEAWQSVGCGKIEVSQTCIGACRNRKVQFVYALEHEEWRCLGVDAPDFGDPAPTKRETRAVTHSQLAGSVQEQFGITKEESQRQLADFLHRNRRWNPSSRSGGAEDFPMTRIRVVMFSRRMLSVTSAYRLGHSTSDSGATRGDAGFHQPDSPLVLVAHGAGGKWDVHARAFDNRLAAFNERQAACEYASDLAKARKDSIVLIRHRDYSESTGAV